MANIGICYGSADSNLFGQTDTWKSGWTYENIYKQGVVIWIDRWTQSVYNGQGDRHTNTHTSSTRGTEGQKEKRDKERQKSHKQTETETYNIGL